MPPPENLHSVNPAHCDEPGEASAMEIAFMEELATGEMPVVHAELHDQGADLANSMATDERTASLPGS